MDSFSDQLRAEAEPIWREIFAHPFLREIKDGTLPLETFSTTSARTTCTLKGSRDASRLALPRPRTPVCSRKWRSG